MKIACLPVNNDDNNPYQKLFIQGLLENNPGWSVEFGNKGRFFALIRTVLSKQPDFIHVDWWHSYYQRKNLLYLILLTPLFLIDLFFVKLFTKTQLVWTLHNITPHQLKYPRFEKWIRKVIYRTMHKVRVFDKALLVDVGQYFGKIHPKIVIVPEGNFISHYKTNMDKTQARTNQGINNEAMMFLFFGGIKPYKGVEQLITSFKKLEANNLTLWIVGKPFNNGYRLLIEQLVGDDNNIKVQLDFIKEENLSQLITASDIVVLPFQKITNSGSVILAMGYSKPVITLNTLLMRSRLNKDERLLFDDHNSLLQSMKHAISLSKEDLNKIGNSNFDTVSGLSWSDGQRIFSC